MSLKVDSDIDIDVPHREKALAALDRYVGASIINEQTLRPHNVGVYLQDIPTFLDNPLSSINYKDAGNYGFYKIDILTNTVYDDVVDEQHLDILLNTEPDWTLLQQKEIVKNIFQIHNYYDLLVQWKPQSVIELAMFIAMIRPSKKHLMQCSNWNAVKHEIWTKPDDGSAYFKKSHAVAYASAIVIQLNLISNVQ